MFKKSINHIQTLVYTGVKRLSQTYSSQQAELNKIYELKKVWIIRRYDIIQNIKNVKRQIKIFESTNQPKISDHALIRYLERSGIVNIRKLKNKLMSVKTKENINKSGGSGKFCDNEEHNVLVVKNNIVVTIYKK